MQKIKEKAGQATKEATDLTMGTVESLEKGVEKTVKSFDGKIAPFRENAFRRFPILFSLLVTFGLVVTLLGIEQVMLKYELLREHPWYLLFIGVAILTLTGTLYKSLDKK